LIFLHHLFRCRTHQQVVCQSGGLTLWRMNGMKFKRVVRRISCSTSSRPCFYWVLLASAAGRRPTHTRTISLTTQTSTVHRWAACWDLLWLDLSTCSQVRHWLIRSVYLLTGETSVDWIAHRWDIGWLDESTCWQVRHWLIRSVYLLTGETSVDWISLPSHRWDIGWLDCSQVRHRLIGSVYLLTGETSIDWISLPAHKWDIGWLDQSTCSQVRHWLIGLLTGETSVDWISLPAYRWDISWLDQSIGWLYCSQVRHWLIGSVYLLTGETSVDWISLTSHWLIGFLLHNAMLSIAQTMLSQDVHLHDTHQYYVETAKHIIKLFSPSNSHIILVFLYQALWQYSDGDPLKGSLNAGGVWKNVIFDHCLALSWNDTRYVYSYCRVWIGSCTVPKLLNGTIFHWTWTTPNPHFKVMPLFDVEYRKYCCHSCC